LGSFTGT
jgi:protein-serine/threonine kinase